MATWKLLALLLLVYASAYTPSSQLIIDDGVHISLFVSCFVLLVGQYTIVTFILNPFPRGRLFC